MNRNFELESNHVITTSSEITFGKDPTKVPKLLLSHQKTFLGIDPRIVPNNFSTNINVRGKFNLNHSYACGMSSSTTQKHYVKCIVYIMQAMVQRCKFREIPAIKSNLCGNGRNDDLDNWNYP